MGKLKKKRLSGRDNFFKRIDKRSYKENLNDSGFSELMDVEKTMKDASTQTNEFGQSSELTAVHYLDMSNVSDLICLLIDSIPKVNSIHIRQLSVIIYLILRLVNVTFQSCKDILNTLSLLSIQRCSAWVNTVLEEDDLCVILRDKRRAFKSKFYETYPELEMEAKAYALNAASTKECTFDLNKLATFVDQRFREIYADKLKELNFDSDELIRSEESCRADLMKWGAKWDKNKNRPYFEGHEREDVIVKRKVIDLFLIYVI